MNEEGLPPPPAPQPRPVSIPKEEGLPQGFTGESVKDILDGLYDPNNPLGSAIRPWRDRIGDTGSAQAPGGQQPSRYTQHAADSAGHDANPSGNQQSALHDRAAAGGPEHPRGGPGEVGEPARRSSGVAERCARALQYGSEGAE